MENKELLQLIKKLESEELTLATNDEWIWFEDNKGNRIIKLGKFLPGSKRVDYYNKGGVEDWNQEFKENFYREKGVKCWVSNCENKILMEKGDHVKKKIPCQDNHTRLICVDCSKNYF